MKISQVSKRSNPIAALPAVEQEADREKKADEGDKLGKEEKSDKDGKSEMPATKDTVTAPPLGQTETKTKEDSHKFEFEKQEMAKPNKLFDLYCDDSSPPRGQLIAPFSGCSEFIPLGSDYKHKDFWDYLDSCKNLKDFEKIR